MSVPQLISHLRECRRHLSELRARSDYLSLRCAMLRVEGAGGTTLTNPFARVLRGRLFISRMAFSHDDNPFTLTFYFDSADAPPTRLNGALAAVESLTSEALRLLADIPRPVRERLVLPAGKDWWRTVFHLAWHFPRPLLRATRERLLIEDGVGFHRSEETFVQMRGTGNRRDLLPGLIYSNLGHDICACSESAITTLVEALQACPDTAAPPGSPARPLTGEERELFRRLRREFESAHRHSLGAAGFATGLEAKLLKLADSFTTPPAKDWADLRFGGCVEHYLTLSVLDDLREICQVRGPWTGHFIELATRAGRALPADVIPDRPILFDSIRRNESGILTGFSGPDPTMNRDEAERWVGFVYAALKAHSHPALEIRWLSDLGPLSYALATLDRDLFAASALAIELVGLSLESGPSPAAQPAAAERITFDDDTQIVTLDGTPHPVADLGAYKFLRELYQAHRAGETPIKARDIADRAKVSRDNYGRTRKLLPERLRALIHSKPGAGLSIRLPGRKGAAG